MKTTLAMVCLLLATSLHAQDQKAKPAKVGWFVTPEVGTMFLGNHIGKTVGTSLGVKIWKNRLKVGAFVYGRSGPINGATFATTLPEGTTYKGQSRLNLRADHGMFGLLIAPMFRLKAIEVDVPIMIGMLGAGFYLAGDDRETPDGARVSEWENKLFAGGDAAFVNAMDVGLRAFIPTKIKGVRVGVGLHYSRAPGLETYYDPAGDFYNNRLRASLSVNFSSP